MKKQFTLQEIADMVDSYPSILTEIGGMIPTFRATCTYALEAEKVCADEFVSIRERVSKLSTKDACKDDGVKKIIESLFALVLSITFKEYKKLCTNYKNNYWFEDLAQTGLYNLYEIVPKLLTNPINHYGSNKQEFGSFYIAVANEILLNIHRNDKESMDNDFFTRVINAITNMNTMHGVQPIAVIKMYSGYDCPKRSLAEIGGIYQIPVEDVIEIVDAVISQMRKTFS